MPYSQSVDVNLEVFDVMVDEMEAYLESDDLTRQLVVQTDEGTQMPNMTIGLMLDYYQALQRQVPNMLPRQREGLERIITRFEDTRDTRIDAYGDKLRREMKSHMDAWAWFLENCEDGEASCVEDYPSEVWRRTRLEDLRDEARGVELDISQQVARLEKLDRDLDDLFHAGEYVGREGTESERPKDTYWWLYGTPVVGDYY